MKRWYNLTIPSTILLLNSIAFSFCCLYDPGSLRISFLGIPLVIYGVVLAVASVLIIGPTPTKFLGFILGAMAFSTFWLGLLPHLKWATREEIEGDVAALALYGTIAAFYWIQAWRRVHGDEEPMLPIPMKEKN